MSVRHRSFLPAAPTLPFALLLALLAVLWFAGGASRADVLGQAVIRGTAATLLVIAILFAKRAEVGAAKPVLYILLAAIALVVLQLIPLPPSLWQALPGRALLAQAVSGAQPWRPWAIVPDAAFNAAASLLVPLTMLLLAIGLSSAERSRLPAFVLALVGASALSGLLQFSGTYIDNPFINDVAGRVTGSFSNRNHFALFLAMGCVVAPLWAFMGAHPARWRGPFAFGLVLLFMLVILASGSRSGVLFGIVGLVVGLVIVRRPIRATLRRYPRWMFAALVATIVIAVASIVVLSVVSGRAVSIERVLDSDVSEDMRVRALPTVLLMLRSYFPAGSGFGGFEALFRMHEPFELLKPTYFNHAHNDFLEIVLDGGVPALLLLVAALAWWAVASFRVWRGPADSHGMLGRLGSTILLLILLASAVDYPARTPMMMAMIVLAAVWLSGRGQTPEPSALPRRGGDL